MSPQTVKTLNSRITANETDINLFFTTEPSFLICYFIIAKYTKKVNTTLNKNKHFAYNAETDDYSLS